MIQLPEVASHPAASGSLRAAAAESRRLWRQRHAGCAQSEPGGSRFIFLFHIFQEEGGGVGVGKDRLLSTVIIEGKNNSLEALNKRWHCPGWWSFCLSLARSLPPTCTSTYIYTHTLCFSGPWESLLQFSQVEL